MSLMPTSPFMYPSYVENTNTFQTRENLSGDPNSNDPFMRFLELYAYDVKQGPIVGMTQEATDTLLIGKVKEMVEVFGTESLKKRAFL